MIAKNRKIYYEYTIIEEYDCGIILTGSEVKSIRGGGITIVDAFAYFKSGEIWAGNPAKFFRQMTQIEKDYIKVSAQNYIELANEYNQK